MTQINRPLMPDEWRSKPTLTVTEAAQMLGISRSSAYDAARSGSLPTIKMGGRVLVPTASLLRLLGVPGDDE